MVSFYGDYNLTETVNIPFNTFSSDDPSASVTVTNLANGDIYVHKDGVEGTPTGITVSLNVGSVNGNHLAILDLSNTNHVGFYAVGARYQVRMEGVTIDGATVNAWIGAFSIGCTLRPTTVGRTLTVESDGVAHADVKEWLGQAVAATVNGRPVVDMQYILGHLLTQTGTQLADGFEHFFNHATPAITVGDAMVGTDSVPTNPMLDTEDGSSFSAIPDMATVTNQTAIAGYIDSEVAAIITALNDGTITLHTDYDAAKTAAQAGDEMDLVDAPNATAVTAIQSGLSTHNAAAVLAAFGVGAALTACATATSVTVSDKTGFSLAATGLDAVATTAPTGVASNFRQMVVQVWRRLFKKSSLTSTELKTYADDGATVLTTQDATDDDTTQTLGGAS